VVYSQVMIHSVETAQQFASFLHSSILQGKTPAVHTKRFIMGLSSDQVTDSVSGDISAVLMEARQLRMLEVYHGGGLQLALIIGARTFSATLTKLDIYVQFAHMPTVLTYVGLFSHLCSLTITFMREDQRDGPPLAIETKTMWNLPHLRSLNMSVMGLSSKPSPFVDFMRTCNFPVVDTVEVHMMVGSTTEAQILSQFLLGLPPLRSLSLNVPIAEYQHIIWPCIRATSFVAWMVTNIQDNSITYVLPLVTESELHIQDACRDLGAVYSFFDGLLQAEDTSIKDIYLDDWFRNPEHHNWIINHRDQVDLSRGPTAMMDFMRYAILLHKKHINLRDGAGKTVMDHFEGL
jgi:hypothetical protein